MWTAASCPAGGKGKTKAVDHHSAGIARLLNWAARHGARPAPVQAVREATGIDQEPTALARFDAGVTVSLVNPAQVKAFTRGLAVRTQPDGVESGVLARFGARLNPPAWQPPPPDVRDWRAWRARREALAQAWRREPTRREQALATATPRRVRPSLDEAIRFLEPERARRQPDLDEPLNRHPRRKADSALLTRSPAVGPHVSHPLLTRRRRHPCQAAGHLAADLGLVPVDRHSGTSLLGHARRSKAGPARVRAVLSMAAVVAIRYNPPVKALYERLGARGKAQKAARGAARRNLVHVCVGVFTTRQPYQAE